MARTLRDVVIDMFHASCAKHSVHKRGLVSPEPKYMEIPLSNHDAFEVPILAFKTFIASIDHENGNVPDAIVIKLDTKGMVPYYKTLDRNMRDVLLESFKDNRLITMEVPDENGINTYYATQGAVFNNALMPIALCSYEMAAVVNPNREHFYMIKRPVLRISPDVYRNRTHPMEKFIVNKLLNACLEGGVAHPYIHGTVSASLYNSSIKIVIDECPFTVHRGDTPSISTTNQELLQLAADHIDELIL